MNADDLVAKIEELAAAMAAESSYRAIDCGSLAAEAIRVGYSLDHALQLFRISGPNLYVYGNILERARERNPGGIRQ